MVPAEAFVLENLDNQIHELNKVLFKEMEPYDWFHGSIHSMRMLTEIGIRFTLGIRIHRHQRVVDGFQQIIEGKQIAAQHVLNDRELVMARTPMAQWEIVACCIRELTAKARPMLYEFDPRIGTTLDYGHSLSKMEWFDPPENIVPLWEDEPVKTPMHKPCPLCGKPFNPYNKPMWVGGNMRWAHTNCWTKGMRKIIPESRVPVY